MKAGAQGLGIDWCITPQMARELAGNKITLQGNFRSCEIVITHSRHQKEVKEMLR